MLDEEVMTRQDEKWTSKEMFISQTSANLQPVAECVVAFLFIINVHTLKFFIFSLFYYFLYVCDIVQ